MYDFHTNFHFQPLNPFKYNDFFGNTNSQPELKKSLKCIIHTREHLRAPPLNPAYPGKSTGPGN